MPANTMANLLGLLLSMYPNRESNITQPTITPPAIPNTPWSSTPWGTPKTEVNPPGPSGEGATPQGTPPFDKNDGNAPLGSTSELPGYGPMSLSERAALGVPASVAGIMTGTPIGLMEGLVSGLGSKIADWAGQLREANPMMGVATPEAIAAMRDIDPNRAADMAAERAQREANISALEAARRSLDAAQGFSTDTPGWGSRTGVASGYGAGEEATSGLGAGGWGGGGDPGTGGRSESDPGGSGMGGDSHGFAKGGVVHAKRPTTAQFGEPSTRGETAIFIPEIMKQAGIQGREQEVLSAMQAMQRMLTHSKRREKSGPTKAEKKEERRERRK